MSYIIPDLRGEKKAGVHSRMQRSVTNDLNLMS
jgi:hypothetical protein